jgi:hypothetical protein
MPDEKIRPISERGEEKGREGRGREGRGKNI